MRGKETVAILPQRTRDRHGDPVGDAPEEILVRGAMTWPRTSNEDGRGWVTVDGLNVYLPRGSVLPGPKDQMRARDEVWDVDGTPADYQAKGAIVTLKKAGT